MCLAVPGKIIEKFTNHGTQMGKVDFDGVEMDICLEATPEVQIGDYVIVHAGFAISVLSQEEAEETLDLFRQIEAMNNNQENV